MKEIVKLIKELATKYGKWEVFNDFLMFAAFSIANAVDKNKFEERENLFRAKEKTYTKEEMKKFSKIFALLVLELDKKPQDVLGELFMALELKNSWEGQFFTPYSVASICAELTITKESVQREIEEKGYVKVNDCCCGGGVMFIAAFQRIKELGFNPQKEMLAIGNDIDIKSVYMSYIQLSLLGIPALIYHQNTLSRECWECFKTPFYILRQYRFKEVK